jgi:hypothetical protein
VDARRSDDYVDCFEREALLTDFFTAPWGQATPPPTLRLVLVAHCGRLVMSGGRVARLELTHAKVLGKVTARRGTVPETCAPLSQQQDPEYFVAERLGPAAVAWVEGTLRASLILERWLRRHGR